MTSTRHERPVVLVTDSTPTVEAREAHDLIASAVVVLSILVEGDPNPRLCIASSEGQSWIEQAGMLRLAERISSSEPDGEEE